MQVNIIDEDNHLLFVNKKAGDLVQSDRTGDASLRDRLMEYIRVKYDKPGNVYLGVPHRLDRPTSGICVFCKTSKSLSRVQQAFANRKVDKTYWALVANHPSVPKERRLKHYLWRDRKQNRSFVVNKNKKDAKEAILEFQQITSTKEYILLKINLITGRHHQIRTQLSHEGWPIIGDMKYQYPKANEDLSIALHARSLAFMHPVRKEFIEHTAQLPAWEGWDAFRYLDEHV